MKISHLRDERLKDCFSRNFVFSGRHIDENISNDEIYSIIKGKENFKKLVFDFDNLSDIEFFKLYKDFYKWDTKEILKVYNDEQFKNPTEFILKTDDVTGLQQTDGHGRDFSYWYDKYYCKYVVIAESGTSFNNRVYTKQEIADMVHHGKIIISSVMPYGKEISDKEYMASKEKYENVKIDSVKLDYKFNCYPYAISDEDIERMYRINKPAFIKIREEFTFEILKADYEKYLKNYKKITQQIKNILLKRNESNKNKLFKIQEDIKNNNSIEEALLEK